MYILLSTLSIVTLKTFIKSDISEGLKGNQTWGIGKRFWPVLRFRIEKTFIREEEMDQLPGL